MFVCSLVLICAESNGEKYVQSTGSIRIYRRHQVNTGHRGGGYIWVYNTKERERGGEKQMKNVSKQKTHVEHQIIKNTGNL